MMSHNLLCFSIKNYFCRLQIFLIKLTHTHTQVYVCGDGDSLNPVGVDAIRVGTGGRYFQDCKSFADDR